MINWNSPIVENATDEQKWDFLRLHRDKLLAASDWTQLPDAPVDKEAWAAYRQALRDLPAQGGDADKIIFPSKPE
jgi:hypothetical protein